MSTIASQASIHDRFKAIYRPLLGTHYRYGGQTDNGFDCSGLVRRVYWDFNRTNLPRTVSGMYASGRRIPESDVQTGDLVFFNTSGRGPSHVGIYLWDDIFLHASASEGVTLSDLQDDYWSRRLIGARRVLQ